MDTKKLRQKILDLAIRGKLVPQDPNDEPASVLLERIRTEKERLIKEGKIKRSKKTASDDEIEAPFEIPESWEWCKLGNIMKLKSGECIRIRSLSDDSKYPVYGGNGINGSYNDYNVEAETLIIGRVGFYCGSIHKTNSKAWVTDNALIVTYNKSLFYVDYLKYALKYLNLSSTSNSTAQPVVSGKGIYPLLIPIPPLVEQQRIINEVERWFSVIDALESNEGDLLKAIDKAKSKILDLAIHGKLVPQDPNDEPAFELLKRINPKFEPCDEVPWELPNNWYWTTLGNISNYGKCIHVEAKDIPNDSWVLELEDLEKDTAKLLQRVTYGERDIKGGRSVFRKGDVLFSKLRTYLNKVLVAPEDGYCSTEIVPISLCDSLSSHYINHVLRSKYFVEYTTSCGYGVKMPRLSTTDACKGLIPLPPKTEQLRIVSKIEELFAVLDSIKESLEI